MKQKQKNRKCYVLHCNHTEKKDECQHFFRFPSNPQRCKAWLQAAGDEELLAIPINKLSTTRFVCSCHFTYKDFKNPAKLIFSPEAVPNKFDPYVEPLSVTALETFGKPEIKLPYVSVKRKISDFPTVSTLAKRKPLANLYNVSQNINGAASYTDNMNFCDSPPIAVESQADSISVQVNDVMDFERKNHSVLNGSVRDKNTKVKQTNHKSESVEFIKKYWQHIDGDYEHKKVRFNGLCHDKLAINDIKDNMNKLNPKNNGRKISSMYNNFQLRLAKCLYNLPLTEANLLIEKIDKLLIVHRNSNY